MKDGRFAVTSRLLGTNQAQIVVAGPFKGRQKQAGKPATKTRQKYQQPSPKRFAWALRGALLQRAW
jgi:hypothetical protein